MYLLAKTRNRYIGKYEMEVVVTLIVVTIISAAIPYLLNRPGRSRIIKYIPVGGYTLALNFLPESFNINALDFSGKFYFCISVLLVYMAIISAISAISIDATRHSGPFFRTISRFVDYAKKILRTFKPS